MIVLIKNSIAVGYLFGEVWTIINDISKLENKTG